MALPADHVQSAYRYHGIDSGQLLHTPLLPDCCVIFMAQCFIIDETVGRREEPGWPWSLDRICLIECRIIQASANFSWIEVHVQNIVLFVVTWSCRKWSCLVLFYTSHGYNETNRREKITVGKVQNIYSKTNTTEHGRSECSVCDGCVHRASLILVFLSFWQLTMLSSSLSPRKW